MFSFGSFRIDFFPRVFVRYKRLLCPYLKFELGETIKIYNSYCVDERIQKPVRSICFNNTILFSPGPTTKL